MKQRVADTQSCLLDVMILLFSCKSLGVYFLQLGQHSPDTLVHISASSLT